MEAPTERSLSRGREKMSSSGRGGIGNIHNTSADLSRPQDGPDDFSVTRGREPAFSPDKILSTGRGGAGNIRSPSRDAASPLSSPVRHDPRQKDLTGTDRVQSFGRGGMGNMSRSRSRGPSTLAQENAETTAARSQSASPSGRSPSKDKYTGVSGFLLHKVLHQHPEEDHPTRNKAIVSSTHKSSNEALLSG